MRERKRKKFVKNYRNNVVFGRSSTLIMALLLVLAIGSFYLIQSNIISVRGETLSELENRKQELELERDRLQAEANRLQSLSEIEKVLNSDDSKDKYVPVDKINYLPVSNIVSK